MIQFQDNTQAEEHLAGQKDKQILFHNTLEATALGPTSTITVHWH